MKEYTDELDAVINISDLSDCDPEIKLSSTDIFDEYEKIT